MQIIWGSTVYFKYYFSIGFLGLTYLFIFYPLYILNLKENFRKIT